MSASQNIPIFFKAPCVCNPTVSKQPQRIVNKEVHRETHLTLAITKCQALDTQLTDLFLCLDPSDTQWINVKSIEICLEEHDKKSKSPSCKPIVSDSQIPISDQNIQAFQQLFPSVKSLYININPDKAAIELPQSFIDGLAQFAQRLISVYYKTLGNLQSSIALSLHNALKLDCLKELELNVAGVSATRLSSVFKHTLLEKLTLISVDPDFDWNVLNKVKSDGINPLARVNTLAIGYAIKKNAPVAQISSESQIVFSSRNKTALNQLLNLSIKNYPKSANFFDNIDYLNDLASFEFTGTVDDISRLYEKLHKVNNLCVRITEIPEQGKIMFYKVTNHLFSDESSNSYFMLQNEAALHIMDNGFKLDLAETRWTRLSALVIYAAVKYLGISENIIGKNKDLEVLCVFNTLVDCRKSGKRFLCDNTRHNKHIGNGLDCKIDVLKMDFSKNKYLTDDCIELLVYDLASMIKGLSLLTRVEFNETMFGWAYADDNFRNHLSSKKIEMDIIDYKDY